MSQTGSVYLVTPHVPLELPRILELLAALRTLVREHVASMLQPVQDSTGVQNQLKMYSTSVQK